MKELNENRPPTVADEHAQRQAHRDILVTWFAQHPWVEITPDALKDLVGDNYQQRISDCRRVKLNGVLMHIENVPKWATDADGSKRKLAGSYRYRPHGKPLGRSADVPLSRLVQPELFR